MQYGEYTIPELCNWDIYMHHEEISPYSHELKPECWLIDHPTTRNFNGTAFPSHVALANV